MNLQTLNIYLASNSPRRRAIFDFLGLNYEAFSLSIGESSNKIDPLEYCLDIVKDKLSHANKTIVKKENSLLIVADTIVHLMGEKLGKPKNRDEAFKMLSNLSGKSHRVLTAVGYHLNGEDKFFWDETEVEFIHLKKQMIDFYLSKNSYMDKAGSYGIQSEDCFFVKRVNGSFSNVVGFPIEKFQEEFNL